MGRIDIKRAEFARRARLLGAFAGVTLAAVMLILARVQVGGYPHDAPTFPAPPRQILVLGNASGGGGAVSAALARRGTDRGQLAGDREFMA